MTAGPSRFDRWPNQFDRWGNEFDMWGWGSLLLVSFEVLGEGGRFTGGYASLTPVEYTVARHSLDSRLGRVPMGCGHRLAAVTIQGRGYAPVEKLKSGNRIVFYLTQRLERLERLKRGVADWESRLLGGGTPSVPSAE